jgi:hypothetical protein
MTFFKFNFRLIQLQEFLADLNDSSLIRLLKVLLSKLAYLKYTANCLQQIINEVI